MLSSPMLLALMVLRAVGASCNPQAKTSLLYEYPVNKSNPGWIENLAVRSNGEIVFTSIGNPGQLHVLNPRIRNEDPRTISGFAFRDTLGIVETEPDVFHVINSDFNVKTVTVANGSNSIWRVDFSKSKEGTLPIPKKDVDVPGAKFLNGLTSFNKTLLHAADSALGVVWAVDLARRKSWIMADDPLMKPVAGQGYLEGINGLHIRPTVESYATQKTLCFTNSQQYIFACLPLHVDGSAAGKASILARPNPEKGFSAINWDDFAYNRHGTAFVATERGNSVQAVASSGEALVVAGGLNSSAIASPTATAFGRDAMERTRLYVTTAGTAFFPVFVGGKSVEVGAQLVAVDVGDP